MAENDPHRVPDIAEHDGRLQGFNSEKRQIKQTNKGPPPPSEEVDQTQKPQKRSKATKLLSNNKYGKWTDIRG